MRISLLVLVLSVFILNALTAQPRTINNLVFEGAGIRGLAYVGALKSLEHNKQLVSIEKVGGTSAGAITALLFVLDYSPESMASIISQTKFQKFNDGRWFFFGGIHRLKKKYGWYRGERFSKWLGALIEAKTGNANITFAELHQKGFKDLYAAAICLNKQELVLLSHETYPQMKVKDAVRISMSIPLYYQAVFMDSLGHIYSKQNKDKSLDIMIDGGLTGNFPIAIFDTIMVDSAGVESRLINQHTLGIRMDEDAQIKEDQHTHQLSPQPISNFSDYMVAFYTMVIESLNRSQLSQGDWDRTVSISSKGIGPKVKKLSPSQKMLLIDSGWKSMQAFLNKN